MSMAGLLINVLFFTIIIAQAIPIVVLGACARGAHEIRRTIQPHRFDMPAGVAFAGIRTS
jgi:hypothetical protein